MAIFHPKFIEIALHVHIFFPPCAVKDVYGQLIKALKRPITINFQPDIKLAGNLM